MGDFMTIERARELVGQDVLWRGDTEVLLCYVWEYPHVTAGTPPSAEIYIDGGNLWSGTDLDVPLEELSELQETPCPTTTSTNP